MPIPDSCTATKTPSFDHLVGTAKERQQNCDAEDFHGAPTHAMMRAIEDGCYGALGRPIQPPMLLWPKPLDLHLERGFGRPVRRLNGDHARYGIGDTASLADALDLRTLLREFASAQH